MHKEIKERSVALIWILSKRNRPKINSNKITKIEMVSEKGIKNSKSNTVGEKYSSNLKEKPTGSIAFTPPDKRKIKAIISLKISLNIDRFFC